MEFFKSINKWFSSKERENLKKDIATRKKAEVERQIEDTYYKRDWKTKTKIGDETYVILNDGTVLTKIDINNELYDLITNEIPAENIKTLFRSIEIPGEINSLTLSDLEVLRDHPDFFIPGNDVYYKGVDLKMPNVVTADFIENIERQLCGGENIHLLQEKYNRLVHFWLKLADSPLQDIGNVLLFCHKNDIRLSKTGNIIGYRRIVTYSKQGVKEEILKLYEKIKNQKQSPSNYYVHKSIFGHYSTSINNSKDSIGNLQSLYDDQDNLSVDTIYTSMHNKGTYQFRIGEIYRLGGGEEPNADVGNCQSGGLKMWSPYR